MNTSEPMLGGDGAQIRAGEIGGKSRVPSFAATKLWGKMTDFFRVGRK